MQYIYHFETGSVSRIRRILRRTVANLRLTDDGVGVEQELTTAPAAELAGDQVLTDFLVILAMWATGNPPSRSRCWKRTAGGGYLADRRRLRWADLAHAFLHIELANQQFLRFRRTLGRQV